MQALMEGAMNETPNSGHQCWTQSEECALRGMATSESD